MAFRSGVKIFSRLKNNGIPGCTIRSLSERRYLVTPTNNESGFSDSNNKENADTENSPKWFSVFSRSKSADSRLPVQSKSNSSKPVKGSQSPHSDVIPELEKDQRFEKTEGPAYLFTKETRHVFSNPDFVQRLPRLDPMPPFSTVEKRLLDLQKRQLHPDYARIEQLKKENIEEQKKFTCDNRISFSSNRTITVYPPKTEEHATKDEPSLSKIGVSKNTKKGCSTSQRQFSTSTQNFVRSSEKLGSSDLTNDGSIIESKSSKMTAAELIKKYIGLYPEAMYMRPNVKRDLTESEENDYLHNILKFISKKECKLMQQCSKENTDKLVNPSKLKNFTPDLLNYYKSKVKTLNKHTSILRPHSNQDVTKNKVSKPNTRTYSTIAHKYRKFLINRKMIESSKRARTCPPRKRNDNKTCKDVKDDADEKVKSLRKQTEGAYDPEKMKPINSPCLKPDCKPRRKYSTLANSINRKIESNVLLNPTLNRNLSRRHVDDTDPTILNERKKTEGGCPIPRKCPKIKLPSCALANPITNCFVIPKAKPCQKAMAPHPAYSECKEDDIEKLPSECKDCPKARTPEKYASPAMFCDQDPSKCRNYSTSASFSFPTTNLIRKKSSKQQFRQKSVVCSLSKHGRYPVSRSFKRKVASRSANRLNMMGVSEGRMEKFFWNKDTNIPAREYAKDCGGTGVADSVIKTPNHLQPGTPMIKDVFKIDAPMVDKVNPSTEERCFGEACRKLDEPVEMNCKIDICDEGRLKEISLKPADHNICTKRSKVCKPKRPDTKTCPGGKPGNLNCSKGKAPEGSNVCCPKINACATGTACKEDNNALRKLMASVFEFFAPRPNCPHPNEWKNKQNKLKAEKAAHEAGMCLVKPPNPTGKRKMSCSAGPPPESKCSTPSRPSSEPSTNCGNNKAKAKDECSVNTEEYDERNPCPKDSKCVKIAMPCCQPPIERCLCISPPKPKPPCHPIEAPYPSFSEAKCHEFARHKINECARVHEIMREQRRKREQPGVAPPVNKDDSELKRLLAELQVACGGPPPPPPKAALKCPTDQPTPKKVKKIPQLKPVPCKPEKLENKTPPAKQCCKPKKKDDRPPCVKGVPQAAPLDKYKEKCKTTPSKCLSTFCPSRRYYDAPLRYSKSQRKRYRTNWRKTRKDKIENGNEECKPVSRTVERGALNAVGQAKLFGYD